MCTIVYNRLMNINLYSWQTECLRIWKKNHCRGCVDVVTGAGKTVLALAATSDLKQAYPALHVFILVPTVALATQWKKAILHALPRGFFNRIGQFGGGRYDHKGCDCIIYVINSAREALPKHMIEDLRDGHPGFLIADEYHRYASPQNIRVFSFLADPHFRSSMYWSLGLSATSLSKPYTPALGDVIFSYPISAALRDGVVSPFILYGISVHFSGEELSRYADVTEALGLIYKQLSDAYPELKAIQLTSNSRLDSFLAIRRIAAEENDPDGLPARYLKLIYQRNIITRTAGSRIRCILSLLQRSGPSRKMIFFCERIDQSTELFQALNALFPGQVSHYHSGLSKEFRKTSLDLFRLGETRLLVTCKALDEGIDVPDASVGIVVSATGVRRQRIQRLGRILRKAQGKRFAVLYYLYVHESNEDSNYLIGDNGGAPVFFLNYLDRDDTFLFPEYEKAAVKAADFLVHGMRLSRKDPRMRELLRCLDLGITRPDWLLPAADLEEYLQRSESIHERNYWICMKHVAKSFNGENSRIALTGQH